LLSKSEELLWGSFKELSEFQLSSMLELIPNRMKNLMEKGLVDNEFYLKILGSGGGGYFLGITHSTIPVVPNCEWL
ncbi:MAG: hypothetical protein MI922_23230, partial [Bacteroidales bacterium]|nr:hypothetical protein [Bacteroidales bacterium]